MILLNPYLYLELIWENMRLTQNFPTYLHKDFVYNLQILSFAGHCLMTLTWRYRSTITQKNVHIKNIKFLTVQTRLTFISDLYIFLTEFTLIEEGRGFGGETWGKETIWKTQT